ncbi:hypothetical protein M5689_024683 [Euphorbia peplus]|nr:hypothetical protein M5689_024674 [Euphorbia peplus]WCJ43984.1 hypothetical protein M5689_024683 [Euphorbia peplus]
MALVVEEEMVGEKEGKVDGSEKDGAVNPIDGLTEEEGIEEVVDVDIESVKMGAVFKFTSEKDPEGGMIEGGTTSEVEVVGGMEVWEPLTSVTEGSEGD